MPRDVTRFAAGRLHQVALRRLSLAIREQATGESPRALPVGPHSHGPTGFAERQSLLSSLVGQGFSSRTLRKSLYLKLTAGPGETG